MRETYRTRSASPIADAYRRLRDGTWRLDEVVALATLIADAEGHGDAARVIERELR